MDNTYFGQKVLFRTQLFGRDYFWMQDGDGTIYLVKAVKVDGYDLWKPDFS